MTCEGGADMTGLSTAQKIGTFLNVANARELVGKLNADEKDDWTYKLVEVPGGKYAYVECYDENGVITGRI